jgi:hypothetical protein
MNAVEFTTELSGSPVLPIPPEVAAKLPKAGKARVILLTEEDAEDAEWRAATYEQFLRDDSPEDERLAPQQPPGIEQLWATEAIRRRDEVRSGHVKPIPGEQVLNEARRKVRR